MKFVIKSEIDGRIRVHMAAKKLSFQEADTLQYYLEKQTFVKHAKVYERTGDVAITYQDDRQGVIDALRSYHFEEVTVPDSVLQSSGRELNATYQEKMVGQVVVRVATKYFLPAPLSTIRIVFKSIKYLWHGIRCLAKGKLEVPVLDATAIGVSILRGNYDTAGSIMFLLGIGETLEEWTHKKSVGDLARSMSLNVGKVWLKGEDQEILTDADKIIPGDEVVIHMGNLIPFDGIVTTGEGMVNQASLTGESQPVHKQPHGYVYAGTVLEEGELTLKVKEVSGSTRYEKVIAMIEESQKLKSSVESKAEHLADKLVPYTFLGTGLAWLFTRNVQRALSVLMVDFSCALKLAMPITVLSAIRESSNHSITVKGGKYLEAMAEATTIVFDKTGTLTKAQPTVKEVVSFGRYKPEEALRVAACLEEHFPHSMAKAVVRAALEANLEHKEMHSKVDYIVAHGIASYINDKRVVIGSYHFVMEDEGCTIRKTHQKKYDALPLEYSHLYMAIDGKLEAVILIEDPLREEAKDVIDELREEGFTKIVMMTGDSERTAAAIAARVGVDEYFSEVLPADKADFVQKETAAGRRVVMVGDGINDSPALSASDVGVAISDGAAIAREIADVTIAADDLRELVVLKRLSKGMMRRIHQNYRTILGINGTLIALGVTGMVQPTTSALIHNTSTLAIGLKSMNNVL